MVQAGRLPGNVGTALIIAAGATQCEPPMGIDDGTDSGNIHFPRRHLNPHEHLSPTFQIACLGATLACVLRRPTRKRQRVHRRVVQSEGVCRHRPLEQAKEQISWGIHFNTPSLARHLSKTWRTTPRDQRGDATQETCFNHPEAALTTSGGGRRRVRPRAAAAAAARARRHNRKYWPQSSSAVGHDLITAAKS